MADNVILSYREKGDKWVEQAEKAQRRVYMDTLVRCKYYDASYYLELAAQCYRIAKRFHDAGMAYKRCGHLEEKLKKPDIAASFYREAAMCLLKEDPQAAVECFSNAISLFCQIRCFSTAARLQIEVAEIMAKTRNSPLAIAGYIKAADFYRANSCHDKASDRCLLKAAHELGLCERYLEAADLFEEIGRRSALDELTKFRSPDLFLKAMLCRLCACGKAEPKMIIRGKGHSKADLPSLPLASSVKAKIVALGKANTVFRTSKAFSFAMDVANARIEGDLDVFAARVYAYNNIFCLDSWCLRILKTLAEYMEVTSAKTRKLHAKQQEKARQSQIAQEHAGMGRRPKADLQRASVAKGAPSESVSVLDSDFENPPVIGTKGELKEASNDTSSSSSSSSSRSDSTGSDSTDASHSTSSDEASSSSESSRSQSGSESSKESGSERSDSSPEA